MADGRVRARVTSSSGSAIFATKRQRRWNPPSVIHLLSLSPSVHFRTGTARNITLLRRSLGLPVSIRTTLQWIDALESSDEDRSVIYRGHMSQSGLDIPPEPAALTTTPPLRGTGHHCPRAPHGRRLRWYIQT